MLIDCPACARSYHVSRAEIGEGGRAVICPRCDAHWFVYDDGTSTLMPSPDDLTTPSFSTRPAVMPVEAADRKVRRSLWQATRPVLAGAACLMVAMGFIGARQRIVRAAPRMAGLYAKIGLPVNVRGLDIVGLTPARLDATTVSVSGEIHNIVYRRVAVPRLVYEVRDAEGAPLASWTEQAPAKTLAKGNSIPFVSSPHQMPPDGHSVLVRFEDDDRAPLIRLARRSN